MVVLIKISCQNDGTGVNCSCGCGCGYSGLSFFRGLPSVDPFWMQGTLKNG